MFDDDDEFDVTAKKMMKYAIIGNISNTYGEVDNAALDYRSAEIQLINREARIAREERKREYDE